MAPPVINQGAMSFSTTIASGDATGLSPEVDLAGRVLLGIQMPAAWTTANLTFAVSADESLAFVPLQDENGTEVTLVAAASIAIKISPSLLTGWRFVKVRSGTNGTPVTQGGARIITLVGRVIA